MRECRLLILVLAGDRFVSNQNLNTQTKTWMKDIPQNVELITYRGGKFDNFDEGRLFLQVSDEYSAISEKTKKAFEWINNNYMFDYIFRTNTSSYIDVKRLYDFCKNNKKEYLYRGRKLKNNFKDTEIEWVSGAEILLSKPSFELLLKDPNDWDIKLPDDVSIGEILQKYKIQIDESNSILFSPSFFEMINFNHEYHFRCRVDSPYYYPRYLDRTLIRYIHKNLTNKKISKFERYTIKNYFRISKLFAFKKHKDYLVHYFWIILKKIFFK